MLHFNLNPLLAPKSLKLKESSARKAYFFFVLTGIFSLGMLALSIKLYWQYYQSIEGQFGISSLQQAQTGARFLESQFNPGNENADEEKDAAYSFEPGSEDLEHLKTALLSIQIRFGLEFTPFVVIRGHQNGKKGALPPYRVINQEGIVDLKMSQHYQFHEQIQQVLEKKRGLYTPVKNYPDGRFIEVFFLTF